MSLFCEQTHLACNMNSPTWFFERLFASPPQLSWQRGPAPPITLPDLLASWLDAVLPAWKLPWQPTARHEELRALYRLTDRIHPAYCRSDQIRSELLKLGVFDEAGLTRLTELLVLFFRLIRRAETQSDPFVDNASLELWWQSFPPEQPWQALTWLRSLGFDVPHRPEAWRCYWRFTKGRCVPPAHPRQWVAICEEEARRRHCQRWQVEAVVAQLAGIGLRAFAGVCGYVPACDACALRAECQWSQASEALVEEVAIATQTRDFSAVATRTLLRELVPELQVTSAEEAGSLLRELERQPASWWHTQAERATAQTLALLELCRRYSEERLQPGAAFRSSTDLFQHFRARLRTLRQEVFVIVILDNKHRYLTEEVITQGLLNRSLVHPREVFAKAIEHRAAAMICLHNHPSGDPQPSPEDHKITQRLKESANLLGISLLDHLVIGNERYVSFADEGWL